MGHSLGSYQLLSTDAVPLTMTFYGQGNLSGFVSGSSWIQSKTEAHSDAASQADADEGPHEGKEEAKIKNSLQLSHLSQSLSSPYEWK